MTLKLFTATSLGTACVLVVAFGLANAPAPAAAADPVEPGSFVWHDLLTRDVAGARRFYGELLGWRFEDTKRGDRPYVIARAGAAPVAGIVDVSGIADAGTQWLSFMAVANVDTTVALFQSGGGKVLVQPRDLPLARVAIVADPQGAPLGLAQMRRDIPGATQPTASSLLLAGIPRARRGTSARLLQTSRGLYPSDLRLTSRRRVPRPQESARRRWPLPASGKRHGRTAQLAAVRTGRRCRLIGRPCDLTGWSRDCPHGAGAAKQLAHRRRRSRRRGARAAKVPVLRGTI